MAAARTGRTAGRFGDGTRGGAAVLVNDFRQVGLSVRDDGRPVWALLAAFDAGAHLFDPHRSQALDPRAADDLPEVAELDLNPVVVGTDGCVVVDARIRVAVVAPADPALRALGC
jgi:hypothetical protein